MSSAITPAYAYDEDAEEPASLRGSHCLGRFRLSEEDGGLGDSGHGHR